MKLQKFEGCFFIYRYIAWYTLCTTKMNTFPYSVVFYVSENIYIRKSLWLWNTESLAWNRNLITTVKTFDGLEGTPTIQEYSTKANCNGAAFLMFWKLDTTFSQFFEGSWRFRWKRPSWIRHYTTSFHDANIFFATILFIFCMWAKYS